MASGKTDMERVGLFKEMTYHTIGDKYKSPGNQAFNESATKGKQMLPGGSKSMSALQHGYFNEKFGRVMEGEAYNDPVKLRRQWRLQASKKNIGKAFLPSSGEKMQSGLGNHYGTLGGPISAFSPVSKPREKGKSDGRNFTTKPGQKGTGFGYINVTIGTYHKNMSEPFDRNREISRRDFETHKQQMKGGAFRLNMAPRDLFDQNPFHSDKPLPPKKSAEGGKKSDLKPFKPTSPPKRPGGMKAGTFDPYPSHSADPYKVKVKRIVEVKNNSGKIFVPSPGPKSAPTTSVINQNVLRSVNSQNYKTVRTVTCI